MSREVTQEQFSDGTTIDGLRIDRALDDVRERSERIRLGDTRARFVPRQYVAGCSPIRAGLDDHETTYAGFGVPPPTGTGLCENSSALVNRRSVMPYLPGTNTIQDAENPLRAKGMSQGLLWTTSLYFKDPVIITDVDVFLSGDGAEAGYAGIVWYPGLYHGKFVVYIDNEFDRDDRRSDQILLTKSDIRMNNTIGAGYSDMLPSFAAIGGFPKGLALNASNVRVPIHRDSRVKVRLGIVADSALEPQRDAIPQLTLTVLEEVAR